MPGKVWRPCARPKPAFAAAPALLRVWPAFGDSMDGVKPPPMGFACIHTQCPGTHVVCMWCCKNRLVVCVCARVCVCLRAGVLSHVHMQACLLRFMHMLVPIWRPSLPVCSP